MQLIIDDQTVTAQKGMTVLEAARANNIYIPTLCDHKDLSPWGACRMCIVEIEGMRGLPTSCTTKAAEGMIVKTQTPLVQNERCAIMQLMLASHPSGCVMCEAKEDCGNAMETLRKSSIITGCGSCPNNGQCEFLSVAENVGADDIKYPRLYRFLPIENQDPFYDRDYNLCILCGRCVRVCEQIRLPDVLSFTKRGSHTKIDTAYEHSHIEAGCEFCGACVAVCPTGTLSEKFRKWEGVPEETVTSTCALCGIGCQVDLLVKQNRVIGSLPNEENPVNHGQLCVKGRFAIAEFMDSYRRLTTPYNFQDGTQNLLTWDEALTIAADRLKVCPPDKFAMVVSTNSTNENLYVAQKFSRVVMGSHHVDTSARLFYSQGFNAYLNILSESVPFSEIQSADLILCLGLDTRYGRSVVGVEIKRALNQGAVLVTIHPEQHNLQYIADVWIQPQQDELVQTINGILDNVKNPTLETQALDNKKEQIIETGKLLKSAKKPILLIGSEFIKHAENLKLFFLTSELAEITGAGIVPLPAQNNLVGSINMGTYPELLPGGMSPSDSNSLSHIEEIWDTCLQDIPHPVWDISTSTDEDTLDVLYVIGDVPLTNLPPSKFTIFQNIYPPKSDFPVDLVLPSVAFTEENGSFTNSEGRIQRVRKAVTPPDQALADWQILVRLADQIGNRNMQYTGIEDIQSEIDSITGVFTQNLATQEPTRLNVKSNFNIAGNDGSQWGSEEYEHSYNGFPISLFVKDMGRLLEEQPKFYTGTKQIHIAPVKEHDHHKEEIIAGTGSFKVIESRTMVPNIHLLRVEAPAVASTIQPGEFVILRVEEDGERIPLSVADWNRETGILSFLVMNVGRTSRKISMLKAGMSIPTVAGPLGNPVETENFGSVLLVGGCYGIGSIHPLARTLKEKGNKVYIAIEARSAHLFYWEEELSSVADKVFYITRDGSKGFQGHVRSQIPKIIEAINKPIDRVFVNGCNFVLRMTSDATKPYDIKTMVSLNTLMIDGTGMCGVCRVSVSGKTKFACVDGPYFDGHEVNWSELDQRRKSYMKEEVITLRSISLAEE